MQGKIIVDESIQRRSMAVDRIRASDGYTLAESTTDRLFEKLTAVHAYIKAMSAFKKVNAVLHQNLASDASIQLKEGYGPDQYQQLIVVMRELGWTHIYQHGLTLDFSFPAAYKA